MMTHRSAGSKSGSVKAARDQKIDIAYQMPAESELKYNNLGSGKVYLVEAGSYLINPDSAKRTCISKDNSAARKLILHSVG
jgi:hypothetical protein